MTTKTTLYFIYFPAGHIDWISRGTAIAMTNDYNDMMARVKHYQRTYGWPKNHPAAQVQGPIEVRTK